MTRTKLNEIIDYVLIVVLSLLVLIAFATLSHAEDKAPTAPVLTDAQRVELLKAEVVVLTKQVENLQAQLAQKEKDFAFQNALKDLYKVGDVVAKDTGADKTDYDLDLNTLTFKQRQSDKPVVTPAPAPKK
jgi:hypothetical protein